MNPFDQLIEIFRKFPGIGPRQAKRFVYHTIRLSNSDTKQFSDALLLLKKSIKTCTACQRYFSSSNQLTTCSICSNPNRVFDQLLIVAHDSDFEAIEKSDTYKGFYFILGGTVPILEQVPSYIRESALKQRIAELISSGLKEIIIAMSITSEGDHTVSYIKKSLAAYVPSNITITTLGRGVSTGSELEYADGDTIKNALIGRKEV